MSTQLLAWLINATFATSIATVAIGLLRKPLQRWLGAEVAFRLWIALPLATIAACFSLPHADPITNPQAQAASASVPTIVVQVTNTLRSLDADRWLLAVWLSGALALVILFAWQQRRFVARLRLRERGDGSWRSAIDDASPAVLGVLRQKLVLPERFETDYSDDEQRLVLAHERMHQQRRDPWALAACASLRTVFWFNPLIHVAAKSFRRDVELASDAAVLRAHPGSIRRYADALLKTHLAGNPLPVGCLWHDTPPMKERIMLLKNALPARRARLAGAFLVCLAAFGATGMALAGHDTAIAAAGALAAATAPAANAPAYQVKLVMSVDGKPVGHPTVVTRAGETAMIKLDDNGVAWGFRFNVQPLANGRVALTGDVVSGSDNHVIGHAHLEETAGGPMEVAIPSGGRKFNIGAKVAVIDHLARVSAPEMLDEGATAPGGERREIRIVSGRPGELSDSVRIDAGTPAPGTRREVRIVTGKPGELPEGDLAEIENDDGLPGEAAMPGAHREVRETRKCSPPDAQGHKKCKITREVTLTAPGSAAPMAPLPPLPPEAGAPAPEAPAAPTPPHARPMAMRAPPAPPALPKPMTARTPSAPPAPPAPPTPMALRTPPAPPAPPASPTPMAMHAPPAPPAPPAPMRLARASRSPVAAPAAPAPPAPPSVEGAAPLPPPPATPEPSAVPAPPDPTSN